MRQCVQVRKCDVNEHVCGRNSGKYSMPCLPGSHNTLFVAHNWRPFPCHVKMG